MACPYFYPVAKADAARQPARAPLGVLYQGRCEMGGSAEHDACNFGYARHACEAFPHDAEADAVRFTTIEGRSVYILERDYLPIRHGSVSGLQGSLRRQAEVFCAWQNP